MLTNKRITVCLALVFAINVFSAMAFGGILDYGIPYTDVSNVTWTGTETFYNDIYGDGSKILSGDINWIVYGPGQFPYDDSGYDPANQYTYVYQIVNTGDVAISDFTVSVEQTVENIASFNSPGRVEGDPASFTDFYSGKVEWGFDGINPPNDEGYNTTSEGLVFRSLKAPTTTNTGRIVNGGHIAGLDSLPVPGTNDIPEPGTIILVLAGVLCVPFARRMINK